MLRHLNTYKDGSALTIMNTVYIRPTKDDEGNTKPDYLDIIYKDNTDGKKYHDILYKPTYTFYMLKPEIKQPSYNLLFEDKSKLDAKTVRYYNLLREISKLTDQKDQYDENIKNQDYGANRLLQKDTRLFNSDQSLEDHYRLEFSKKFTNTISKVSKGYFDIETDIRYTNNDFPELGECPINAISYFDEMTSKFVTFLLRNPKNPLIDEFENHYVSGDFNNLSSSFLCNECTKIDEFVHANIGESIYNELNLGKISYKIYFYDDEINIISDFFKIVNTVFKPDFIGGWNSDAFDIAYIIARIQNLGYDPKYIMTDPDWEEKYVVNYVDQRHINELPERGDFTYISGSTVWIDYMIQFASRRKAKFSSFGSMKLDSIGELVAHVRKLDYSNITNNIGDLPYLDYNTFVLYNIFDVLVLKCIESKNQDIEYLFNKSIINNTSYNKAHRQTVYLVNRMTKEWDKMGYIIGNNNNRWNEKPEKYLGALVQDPLKTNDYSKQKINGKAISIIDNCQDYDFKSLYPSDMLQFNIAPNTQIGRIEIDHAIFKDENPFLNEKYSRGGDYIEALVTDNILVFCHRWLHLADIMEFLSDWDEYNKTYLRSFGDYTNYYGYMYYNHQLYTCPIEDLINKNTLIKPITFGKKGLYKPIFLFSDIKDSGVKIDE